jgi:hypothetical protein
MKLAKTFPEIDSVQTAGRYLLGTGRSIDWDRDGASHTPVHDLTIIDASSYEVAARIRPQVSRLQASWQFLQVVPSPDGRYAYLLSEGDGWAKNEFKNVSTCQADCRRIAVVDLERGAVIATRSLVQQGVNLVGLGR